MDKFLSDLPGGIVGGLIASIVLFIVNVLYKKAFLPFFENQLYNDVRIDNCTWTAHTSFDGEDREITWTIYQTGHHIKGEATPLSGPNKGKRFKAVGSFRNLILTLNFSTVDKAMLDRGCMALRLSENGTRLVGYLVCYDQKSEKLMTSEYVMTRMMGVTAAGPSAKK